jgi:hypothetical protein
MVKGNIDGPGGAGGGEMGKSRTTRMDNYARAVGARKRWTRELKNRSAKRPPPRRMHPGEASARVNPY